MTRTRRNRRAEQERGVTLVEYVLFISGFVLVALTAVGGMNSTARSYFQQSSSRIGQPINKITYDQNGQRQQQASTTSITAPPASSTTTPPPTSSTTTTTSTSTTTTTTTPPTTTTTTPPTTTTSTTTTSTTTTTTPKKLSTSLSDYSYDDPNNNRWVAKVRVTVTATGGASVNGVAVSATFTRSNGSSVSRSCTTNSSGVCYMSWTNRPYSQTWIDVDIDSVTGGAQWTGSSDYKRLYSP